MSSEEECTICTDPLADLFTTMLDCEHIFHTVCIRRYLSSLREQDRQKVERGERPRDAPELPCPYCRKGASAETIDSLSVEHRNIHFEYVLSRVWSEDPDAEVRVVMKGSAEEEYRTSRMKIADLPRHPDRDDRAFLITDLEIVTGDPRQRYETWVEAARTRFRISQLYSVGTTALDHESEDEREAEQRVVVQQQQQPQQLLEQQSTGGPIRGRRSVSRGERYRKELLRLHRNFTTCQRRVDAAQTSVERAQKALDKAKSRFVLSKRRLDEAGHALLRFNDNNSPY